MNKLQLKNNSKQYLVVAAMMFLEAGYASAMDYTFGYTLPVETEYDSNVQMTENNKQSIIYYRVIPKISFIARDERDTYTLDGALLVQRSSDKSLSQNREDPTIGLSWQRDFARGNFTLSTDYVKSSTRTSEFTRTGSVFRDGSSTSRSYDANLNYSLSETLYLSSGLGYRKQTYSSSQLSDYNTKYLSSKLSYLYSEQLSPFVDFIISRYTNDGSNVSSTSGDSTSTSLMGGFSYQVDPKLNFNMAVGENHLSSTGKSSWIGSAGIDWSIYDRSTLAAKLARTVRDSGLGDFQRSDTLTAAYAYQLTSSDSTGVDVSWNKNRSINNTESKDLGLWYRKELTEHWSFRTNAQYRNLKDSVQDANGYVLGVSFSYNQPNF